MTININLNDFAVLGLILLIPLGIVVVEGIKSWRDK